MGEPPPGWQWRTKNGQHAREKEPHAHLSHRGGGGCEEGEGDQPACPGLLRESEHALQGEGNEQPGGVVGQHTERLAKEECRDSQHEREHEGNPWRSAEPIPQDNVSCHTGGARERRDDEANDHERSPKGQRECGQQPVDKRARPSVIAGQYRPRPDVSHRCDDLGVHDFVARLVDGEAVTQPPEGDDDHHKREGQNCNMHGARL